MSNTRELFLYAAILSVSWPGSPIGFFSYLVYVKSLAWSDFWAPALVWWVTECLTSQMNELLRGGWSRGVYVRTRALLIHQLCWNFSHALKRILWRCDVVLILCLSLVMVDLLSHICLLEMCISTTEADDAIHLSMYCQWSDTVKIHKKQLLMDTIWFTPIAMQCDSTWFDSTPYGSTWCAGLIND